MGADLSEEQEDNFEVGYQTCCIPFVCLPQGYK